MSLLDDEDNTPFETSNTSDLDLKLQYSIETLTQILGPIPSLSSSQDSSLTLLHDTNLTQTISTHLKLPNSGAGDNNLCRWLYDTFQSSHPDLQLVVLSFLPIIAGLYLPRAVLRATSLAGFEAILLALYAHETTSRDGQPITVSIPDLSNSSLYHESKAPIKNKAVELNMTIVSPSLEPHGTVRSTRRARIVGVALELYYKKIALMPMSSKIEFCKFCLVWATGKEDGDGEDSVGKKSLLGDQKEASSSSNGDHGVDGSKEKREMKEELSEEKSWRRVPLPWELLQPALRILGHCLMGPNRTNKELTDAALSATKSLHARALQDVDSQAILATGSLLRLGTMASETSTEPDHTEIRDYMNPVISL
ncbi:hypothetical protein Syun_016472 [Stephania yunnanensis]|uniref:Hyccin n=1 Tax=Stephania yunnanensis TaxID=152371 RepID=A0AAP0P3Y1_9MAGN